MIIYHSEGILNNCYGFGEKLHNVLLWGLASYISARKGGLVGSIHYSSDRMPNLSYLYHSYIEWLASHTRTALQHLCGSCELLHLLWYFVTPGASHLTEKWAVPPWTIVILRKFNIDPAHSIFNHVINISIIRFIALRCWNLMPCLALIAPRYFTRGLLE